MRRFPLIATLAAALVGALAPASSALAADGPPMSVKVVSDSGASTNYFQVTGQPGQVVSAGTLRLGNLTARPLTVLLDPVRGMTASTLGSAYGLRGGRVRGPASWVWIDQRRVALAPHAKARVAVSVRIASGVRPGQYLAGVGVQAGGSGSVETHGSVQIASIQRYAVGVETTIPGPQRPHVRLTGARLSRQPAGVTFSIAGRNDGNVILQNVQGRATITSGGRTITKRPLGPGTFVTGTAIAYPILVPKLTAKVGTKFHVHAYLRYPGGIAKLNKTVEFGQVDAARQQAYGGPAVQSGGGGDHLWLILVIAGVVVALTALALEVRRRRSRLSSGEGALRRALPRQIAHARASGEPLNVILIPANGQAGNVAAEVRECLRTRDRLFEIEKSGLMVVSPDTGPEAGEMLAAEIRRKVAREGGGSAVVAVTDAAGYEADQLLEAATAAEGNGSDDRALRR